MVFGRHNEAECACCRCEGVRKGYYPSANVPREERTMRRSERFYAGIYRDTMGSSWAVFDRCRPASWVGSHDPILWLAYPGEDGAPRAASVLGEYLSGVRVAI